MAICLVMQHQVSTKELVFFTKRFNHTAVVFFSGNNTI